MYAKDGYRANENIIILIESIYLFDLLQMANLKKKIQKCIPENFCDIELSLLSLSLAGFDIVYSVARSVQQWCVPNVTKSAKIVYVIIGRYKWSKQYHHRWPQQHQSRLQDELTYLLQCYTSWQFSWNVLVLLEKF